MFIFKLWGKFGVFRDPLTITQNITMPFPPKTTVGGILATVIGKDYNEYFTDEDYFNFEYSVVLLKDIRKKSFTQNYLPDYTKEAESKLIALSKDINCEYIMKKKSKPTFRELLIEPEFLIFVFNYKFENEVVSLFEKHESKYPLYLGNSEFAANYEYIVCKGFDKTNSTIINSFTTAGDKIKFEPDQKYTRLHAATRVVGNREYRDYKNVIISNKEINFKTKIPGVLIKTNIGEYCCEFI